MMSKIDLMKNAEILEMFFHKHEGNQETSRQLPNLHTLILASSVTMPKNHHMICFTGITHKEGKVEDRPCTFLDNLSPRRIIVHLANLVSIHTPLGIPSKVFEEAEEAEFISPTEVSSKIQGGLKPLPKMKNLKKFTWIFWTDSKTDKWRLKSEDVPLERPDDLFAPNLASLARTIFELPEQTEVLIINSGLVATFGSSSRSYIETQKQIKNDLAQIMYFDISIGVFDEYSHIGFGEEGLELLDKATHRSLKIKYLSMEEYLETQDWRDIWESEEIREWLG
ncbi:uncharacterized protein L201_001834 [Kwoniella dendrophila CBS 6074]|uniref:Uncharacterized protein n=1 Tax=Kwoniella dendrophila CBS 6074 TaxID=1295534 RepID=A0AAX4JR28_9TREE